MGGAGSSNKEPRMSPSVKGALVAAVVALVVVALYSRGKLPAFIVGPRAAA
jgi:hypothetical protein